MRRLSHGRVHLMEKKLGQLRFTNVWSDTTWLRRRRSCRTVRFESPHSRMPVLMMRVSCTCVPDFQRTEYFSISCRRMASSAASFCEVLPLRWSACLVGERCPSCRPQLFESLSRNVGNVWRTSLLKWRVSLRRREAIRCRARSHHQHLPKPNTRAL